MKTNNLVLLNSNTRINFMQKYKETLNEFIEKNIIINTKAHVYIIKPENILYVKASSNYSKIYDIDGHEIISSKTLKYFVDKLIEKGFIRVHTGTLVNLEKVKGIKKRNGNYTLILENDIKIPVSRSYREALFTYLFY